MHKEASAELASPFEMNFFFAALPNPVFEDDLGRLRETYLTGILGLASLGLGETEAARDAFTRVLQADPSHLIAWEELRRI
jgi:Tfp pilus assembly protein PilF